MQALNRAKRQQIENLNLAIVSAHQQALVKEAHEQLVQIGPLYAAVILEQSSVTHFGMRFQPHQDALFFETLYKVCT
jgi:hypothetical protein